MKSGKANKYKFPALALAGLFFCVNVSAGDIPVKDGDAKDAIEDVEDAVKDNTDYLREATEALATTISGGLVAQSEGINSSIGNMTVQIVAALNKQALVDEKMKTARLFDPAISEPSPGSCGRANVVTTASDLVRAAQEKSRTMSRRAASHHSTKSPVESDGDKMGGDSARVVALADSENGLIELRGITRSSTTEGSVLDEDIKTASRLDTLVNPFPATPASSSGKTVISESIATVYNSKKLIVSDTLSDIVSQRIAPVEVTDPYVTEWAELAGVVAVDGTLSMSKDSYRVLKNTYRRNSLEWLKHIETQSEPVGVLRDVAMAMAQQLENQEEIIQLLTKSLSIQALSYSQLVDNEMPRSAGSPLVE